MLSTPGAATAATTRTTGTRLRWRHGGRTKMTSPEPTTPDALAPALPQRRPLREIVIYFLRLGTLGFGGPVALVGLMEKELVQDRGWLTKEEMRDAVAVSQSLPGPLAIQVGIFIAYLRGGFWAAWAGGWAFIVGEGHGSGRADAVDDSRLGEELPVHARPTVGRALRVSAVWLVLWLGAVVAILVTLGVAHTFSEIGGFFSKMAVVTFGGAYAVLAYMAQQAVETYGWLQPGEMLDGLGMAETTPGPLIMVVQFVGFMAAYRDPGALPPLLAGTLGGLLATWTTFVPCFLWIGLGAPFIERLRDNKPLSGALAGITAAVVGVILNLAVWFASHTIFRETGPISWHGLGFDMPVLASINPWAFILSLAAITAIVRFKAGTIQTLAACSAAGIMLYLAGLATP